MNRTVRSLALGAAFMLPAGAPERVADIPNNHVAQPSTAETTEKVEITFRPIEDEDQGLRFVVAVGGLFVAAAIGDWINRRLDRGAEQEGPPTPE